MVEKPREKFIRVNDARKMSTEELFSILLGHGSSSNNVFELSSSISNLLRTRPENSVSITDLMEFDGIGEVKAMQILSALELGRRYFDKASKPGLGQMDWDFANLKQADRQYGVHSFHHYTAKFIPQIPSRIIQYYAHKNSVVVDPFMGSGTTLVEAKLHGCHSYGLDTNPMAFKITRAKTLKLTKDKLEEIDDAILRLADATKNFNLSEGLVDIELFPGSNQWFRNDVSQKLNCVIGIVRDYSPDVRNFLEVGYSNLLKGMSNARMDSVTPVLPENPIYIDRKHYYREVNNLTRDIPVFRRILTHFRKMREAIIEFNQETDDRLVCESMMADARKLSKFVDHCDLVITSPPYWSAQNYGDIHKLSMGIFDTGTEVGKEIGQNHNSYLDDMNIVVSEVGKILKGHFVIVMGHDEKRQTHEKLYGIILQNGFEPVDTIIRQISNQVSRAKQIKEEYIYVFKK